MKKKPLLQILTLAKRILFQAIEFLTYWIDFFIDFFIEEKKSI